MNPLAPYMLYIRIALFALVVGGTAWASAHWATQVNESKWLKKQADQDKQVLAEMRRTELVSQDTGAKYEQDRAKVQRVVSTPDRKLDAILQTPVGDIVIPGDLGVRLNAIASAADDQTGQAVTGLDSGLHSGDSVPNSERAASGVEAASGGQYRIGH